MAGPLSGVKVIEMAGMGPGPFCTMMLADAGAEVITISRKTGPVQGVPRDPTRDATARGRRHLTLDLKKPKATELVLKLIEQADVVIEGYRPGVMERLGLGPEVCHARNPRLVYGRMTGWGQSGPLAQAAGHDLNYISICGAAHAIGTAEQPLPPLNLVGDYGGGAMMLAFGVAAALYESRISGKGQVIDAAMSDGAALLMAPFYSMAATGNWKDTRQSNMLDGSAPFYGSYRCSDGGFISIAPLEPQFYDTMLRLMELDDEVFRRRDDRSTWPEIRQRLADRFASRTRDEWCAVMEGSDACFAPVLGLLEAPKHAHNQARGTFVEVGDGAYQPAPAPRFERTVSELPGAPRNDSATTEAILQQAGLSVDDITALRKEEVVYN